ncbi:tRNA A64-2'-O-ribosylphosphate transferase [Taxawa tesnikishii (nom. ined.)]|nr:tRNA A64-2'-O-ribosylphosphate transferase [Dothideales sp. JES 119]
MSGSEPLQLSDLIFSNAATDFNRVLGDIKRATLSIRNRLQSIEHDAAFVASVAEAYGLPLVANERCGSWYIPPSRKEQSAYFKSTDGHISQWSFSLRRLNLQVLDTIAGHEGCIIIDSTRRGKSMPDALSKTVPIWTTVLNRVLFPSHTHCHELRTPGIAVTASEHSQIEARIAGFVTQLQTKTKSLSLDLSVLRDKLRKPLQPLWVTQDSLLPFSPPTYPDVHPVVLCTASRRVPAGEASEGGYIQGAADDSESWAHGLTAPVFWTHKDELLRTSEESLPSLISSLTQLASSVSVPRCALIEPTRQVYLGTLDAAALSATSADFAAVITASPTPDPTLASTLTGTKHLHLPLSLGKVGSRQLRHELPELLPFLVPLLTSDPDARVLVACPSGKDHSVGIALAILCLLANEQGDLAPGEGGNGSGRGLNKQTIKQRLSWIMVSVPDANPSRATLQSVNALLLG